MKLCWRDIRPSFLKYNSKTTAIPEIIPVVLICTAGIILPRPDVSLSCSFAPQGLFPPAECISIFLFCPTGIISAARMHLYLPLLLPRDYFNRPDSSLSCSFLPQGLFCPGRMHLYLPLLLHRDYFHRPDASLSSSFLPQGLFPPAECISILLFSSTGIISTGRMHLYLPLLLHRDYFRRSDASLSCSFLHRDYFHRSDASLSSSFAPQGLFLPPGCIPSLLFCFTGIISAGRMHLYLALLFHRDYFQRPDASPACSFVPQGLFLPAECISNPGSCKVSATKLLLHRKHSYGFCWYIM